MNKKLKLLFVCDEPDSILSYGLLGKMLVDRLYKYYDIHYLSLQRTIGIPFKRDGKYIKHAARPEGQRNPTSLPHTIMRVKPNIVWTNFDVQVYEVFLQKNYVSKGASWIGWLPWDNEDASQLNRTKRAYSRVDARIAISQFGYQFLSTKIKMDGYIYNIADTDSFYPLSDEDENGKLKKFKEKLKWYDKKNKYLIFVGRPNWRKGMTHMMAIMKELQNRGRDDIKLILHSNIRDPACETNLPEVIDAFGVKNLIHNEFYYDEGISKGDLNCYYNLSDLYIAPHIGEGFCVLGNQHILTENGEKEISEVKIGEKVLTHKNRYMPVVKTFKRYYKGKGVKITRYYDTPFVCTPEHPILTNNGWKEAKNINNQDWLVKCKNLIPKYNNFEIPMKGNNIWWLIGLYLAEGYSGTKEFGEKHRNWIVYFGLHEKEVQLVKNKISNILLIYGNSGKYRELNSWEYKDKNTKGSRLSISNKALWSFFQAFGRGAKNKHIPYNIFNYLCSNLKAREGLLDGYLFGDGYEVIRKGRRNKNFSICSISYKLLRQIKKLLEIDGKFAYLFKTREEKYTKIKGKEYHINDRYDLRWNNNQENVVYIKELDKYFIKIRNVEEIEIDEGVYNLEVGKDNTYTLPQGIVHNCMPIVESMSTGTPFVASDFCTTPEFAGENNERGFPAPIYYPKDEFGRPVLSKGVMRPYPKVKEFADTIEKALEDENRLETMGEKGVRWARKHCSPAVVAAAWKNVFDSFDVKVGKVEDYK